LVYYVALSPDAKRLGFGTETSTWEGPVGGRYDQHSERGKIQHGGAWFAVKNVMLDESGPFAMIGTSEIVGLTQGGQDAIVQLDHALLVVDVRALRDEPTLPGTPGHIQRLAADDGAIAALDDTGLITVWDAATCEVLVSFRRVLRGEGARVRPLGPLDRRG
jgi:hypothetical protein